MHSQAVVLAFQIKAIRNCLLCLTPRQSVVLAFQIKAIRNVTPVRVGTETVVLAFQIKAIRNTMFAKHCISVNYNMFCS